METKQVGGLLLAVIMLASGGTLYLQDAGSKSSCSTGWTYKADGLWSCGARTSYCYDVTNSSTNKNYWCIVGKPFFPEVLNNNSVSVICGVKQYSCNQTECVDISRAC